MKVYKFSAIHKAMDRYMFARSEIVWQRQLVRNSYNFHNRQWVNPS